MAGAGMAVLSGPILAAALTCLALPALLFALGETLWLQSLGKPYG